MIKRLINLEWKQFKRSAYFKQGLAIKILLIFGALYFTACFLMLGIGAFFILEEVFPNQDPLVVVNNYIVFWILFSLIYRFFIQKMPVMKIKPYMVLPIPRKTIIHYMLGKTGISFFNILPLFFYVPFCVVLLSKAYPALHVIGWFLTMISLELCVNFINFLINKNNSVFYGLLVVLLGLAGLEYFQIYPVTSAAGYVFNTIYDKLYAFLIPVLVLIQLYRVNFKMMRKGFYLDEKITKKTENVHTLELNWLNRFGGMAVFLKNDIRMIWRNKRPRKVLFSAFFFLFYGLFFFTQDIYRDSPAAIAFASVFISGGFLMTFGQLVPAWDSEYYKLLMSQNIPYRHYLEAKWYLMIFGTVLAAILTFPYVFFGWKIYAVIVAAAIFNIGINTFVTLYGGALNRMPVELNAKAKMFGNTQGFNMTQLLIALPKMILPVLLFLVPYYLIGFKAGLMTLALVGIVGLACKNYFLSFIESIYQNQKYKTIAAFDEKK